MYNYVNSLLIAKSSGANTGTSLQTIAPGDILFINGNDQTVLDAATIAALPNNVPVYAAMGVSLGVPRLSSPIRRREITKFTREAFREAVTQQVDVTLTGMTAGKKYRLIVQLRDEFKVIANRPTKLEIPSFIATSDATADANKLAAMVTKFKATYGLIKGSVVGGKLRIEGQPVPTESIDDYQIVSFTVAFTELVDPVLGGPTSGGWSNDGINQEVVTVRKADTGSGKPVQLVAMERMASGYRGNNDLRNIFDRPALASRVDQTASYDLIHVLHFDKHQGDHEFTMESPLQTTFATASGSTLSTYVETMLKAFVNKDAAASTSSTPDPDAVGGTSPE